QYAKLDGKAVTTLTGVVGVNVICVQDIVLSGKQVTLTGPAGAEFIVNVRGRFVFTGGGQGPQLRVAGGVLPSDVLYNIIGAGSDVAFSGGGGGVGCGNTYPDATGVGMSSARVRSEGAGNPKVPGDGRVYHIRFTGKDH